MSDSSVDDRQKDTTLLQGGDRAQALHAIMTEAEALYRLEFDLALRAEAVGTKHAIQVFWNETLVGTATASSAGAEHFTFELVGTGKADQLRFDGGGADGDLLLDNVRLSNGEQSLSLATGGFAEPDAGADDGAQSGSQGSEEGAPLTVETTAGAEPRATTMDMVKRTDAAISTMVTSGEEAASSQSGDPGASDAQRGDDGANVMIGGSGADKLHGTGGSDQLDGGSGEDVLRGGRGNDELLGGTGDDMLRGRRGADTLVGGAGDDTFHGGSGRDVAEFSGKRADYRITAVDGGGLLVEDLRAGAPDGNDALHKIEHLRFSDGEVAAKDLRSGDGDGSSGAGGAGAPSGTDSDDVIRGDAEANELSGGAGDDRLHGTPGGDKLDGGAGDDLVRGGRGKDEVVGGAGDDELHGRSGADTLRGGVGDDTTVGGPGMDTAVFGGKRVDYRVTAVEGGGLLVEDLRAGTPDGKDTLHKIEQLRFADGEVAVADLVLDGVSSGGGGGGGATDSDDVIRGDAEANELSGGAGDDRLHGTPGDDKLDGGAGDDLVRGGRGKDEVVGSAGDDELHGRSGADTLRGGVGDDTTVGGPGMDTAVFGGKRVDYRVTAVEGGGLLVEDLRAGTPDGKDTLHKIEQLRFADGEVAVADLMLDSDVSITTAATVAENVIGAIVGAIAGSGDTAERTVDDPRFAIVDGKLALKADQSLDHEASPSVTVKVTSTPTGGSPVEQTFTIAVADVDEAPVVTAIAPITLDEEATPIPIALLAGAVDPEAGDLDVARVTIVADDGRPVAFTVDGETGTLTIDPGQFDALGLGRTLALGVGFDVVDEGGAATPNAGRILVTGSNDAPVVAAIAPTAVSEAQPPVTLDLLAGAVDPDSCDLDVASVTLTAADGRPVTFTLDPENGALGLDPRQFDDLGQGQILTLDVAFNVVDSAGASTASTARITVTGSGDGPPNVVCGGAGGSSSTQVGQDESGAGGGGGTPGGQAETGAGGTPSDQGQSGSGGSGGTPTGQAETGAGSGGGTPGGQAESDAGGTPSDQGQSGSGSTPSGQAQSGSGGSGGTPTGQAESGDGGAGGSPSDQGQSASGGTPGGQNGFAGFPGSGTGGSHGGGGKGGSDEGFVGFPGSGTSGGKGGTGKGGGSHGGGSKGGSHEGFAGFPDSGTGGGKGGSGKGGGSHGGGGKGGSHEGFVGFPDSGTGGGKGGTGKGGGSHGGGKGGSHHGFAGFPGDGIGGGSHGGGSKGGKDHSSPDFPPRCAGGITLAEDGPVTIRFESEGAGYRNGFGLYRIDTETGAIHDVQLLWANASAVGSGGSLTPGQSVATIEGEAGDRLGFFIVENGAGQLEGLDLARGSFVFVDPTGAQASIGGGVPQLWFAAPGATPLQIPDNVYHTIAPGEGANLNPDGIDHARLTLDTEHGRMSMAFEDLAHGGDRDFDDVVVSIDLGPATATALTGLFGEAVEATLPATLPAAEHADLCAILAPDEIAAGPLAVEDVPLVIVAEGPDFFATALDCEVAPPSGPGHHGGEPGGFSDPVLPPPEPEDTHVAHDHHHGGHHGHGC